MRHVRLNLAACRSLLVSSLLALLVFAPIVCAKEGGPEIEPNGVWTVVVDALGSWLDGALAAIDGGDEGGPEIEPNG
ncbi:MAG: hypothetical protein AAGN46_05495 [Acidobacteriota bacterium]